MVIEPVATVGQIVAAKPGLSRVFETLGIDYCCGGRKPLAQACRDKGLVVEDVVAQLEIADAAMPKGSDSPSVATMGMSELADHIEQTHHAWLRRELPRMASLLGKLADAHGNRDPRLIALRDRFEDFAYELFAHMQKEEQVLFPAARELERGGLDASQQARLEGPLEEMTREHDEAGAALLAMRSLTDDFGVPEGACNTHRAALDALRTLEADMHQHVHKENNVLFPRVRHAAGLPTL